MAKKDTDALEEGMEQGVEYATKNNQLDNGKPDTRIVGYKSGGTVRPAGMPRSRGK